MSEYMLKRRRVAMGLADPEIKVSNKKIPHQSDKRKEDMKVYRKLVKELLQKNPNCKIKSPVCTGKAEGLDHTQKRSPDNLLDKNNLVPACNACNLYKENYPEWAKENGHSVSRFKKKK